VKEEEETLGQLRDRQVLASAPASVPGPRAAFVHIQVQNRTSGKGGGGGGGEEATGERQRDASACMRRHQASALAPVEATGGEGSVEVRFVRR
jgi:hypothetical protein